jgi:hypothetical protein
LALPQGAPQPPARFTPFIKSQPTRDHTQWGDPEPFAQLPQSFEAPSILQGVSQFFGQHGSQLTIPLALSMGKYAGAFVTGLQQGQEFKAKMAREQMEDNAYKLQQQTQMELHAYSDVFNKYGALNETMDWQKMSKGINGVPLKEALYQQAVQLGDDNMTSLIENGANVGDIMYYQKLRDASLRDLQKTNAKTDEQTALDELYDVKPAAQAGVQGADATPAWAQQQPSAAGGQPTAPGPNVDPGQPAPTQPDATGQVAGPGAPSGPPSAADTMQDGATQILRGYEPGTYVPADVKNKMAIQAAGMRKKFNDIISDPNIAPDQVVPEVRRQLGDGVAADLQGLMDYRRGPGVSGQSTGGKEQGYWNMLSGGAAKARPGRPSEGVGGWNSSNFQEINRFKDPNGQTARQLIRVGPAVGGAEKVINDLKMIKREHPNDFNSLNLNLAALAASTDPWQVGLRADWLQYNQEVNALVVPGGSVTETMATEATVPWYGSAADYMNVVKQHMGVANERIDEAKQAWSNFGSPDPMPFLRPGDQGRVDRVMKLDPVHMAMPGDVRTAQDLGLGSGNYKYVAGNPNNPFDYKRNWVRTTDQPTDPDQ